MSAEDRIGALLIVLLEAAQGAGMSKERAEAIFEDIRHHFKKMNNEFPEVLLSEIQRLMDMP